MYEGQDCEDLADRLFLMVTVVKNLLRTWEYGDPERRIATSRDYQSDIRGSIRTVARRPVIHVVRTAGAQ